MEGGITDFCVENQQQERVIRAFRVIKAISDYLFNRNANPYGVDRSLMRKGGTREEERESERRGE